MCVCVFFFLKVLCFVLFFYPWWAVNITKSLKQMARCWKTDVILHRSHHEYGWRISSWHRRPRRWLAASRLVKRRRNGFHALGFDVSIFSMSRWLYQHGGVASVLEKGLKRRKSIRKGRYSFSLDVNYSGFGITIIIMMMIIINTHHQIIKMFLSDWGDQNASP